jgi:bifunctional N-acetylglucosamine-1-phosphate-uridyltransferase/glucosamine-1-phosphate-acetyltransferase GlmU-like protein
MKRVLEPAEVSPLCTAPRKQDWTALIAAAGRGSRLGFDKPKILYPVAGRPILAHLVALLEPFCQEFVFVLSPTGTPDVQPELERLLPGRYTIAEQSEPLGMGHAVRCGLEKTATPCTLLAWGDQVALRPSTIGQSMGLLTGLSAAEAVVPTAWRDQPYIHLERDGEGRIARVLQAREGEVMPERGESDTGLFVFRTGSMRQALEEARGHGQGAKTGEENFLPVLSRVETVCARIAHATESLGVNTRADAERLEEYFRMGA